MSESFLTSRWSAPCKCKCPGSYRLKQNVETRRMLVQNGHAFRSRRDARAALILGIRVQEAIDYIRGRLEKEQDQLEKFRGVSFDPFSRTSYNSSYYNTEIMRLEMRIAHWANVIACAEAGMKIP